MSDWDSKASSDYLKQFFERAFMRERDRFATTEIPRLREAAARRGAHIPSPDELQSDERIAASLIAFPELVEEIKCLISEGKLPSDARGKGVADAVINDSVQYTGGHGKDGHRAALRALADIRLLFQQAALPRGRGHAWLELLAWATGGLGLLAALFILAAALFPKSPHFSWVYDAATGSLFTLAGVVVGIPFAISFGLALFLRQQGSSTHGRAL